MSEHSVSEYDKFAYPSGVYAQTHPDRLATIATLIGLPQAPIERASVLEFGCGDGSNLITMACTLPDSELLGIDLAVEPIRRGQEQISALDLKNVTLRRMNILESPGDLGTFDYIIAHGLYSWVPDAVREKILALCRGHLAPNGVAYISYNVYPGNHLRDLARGMMRFHARQFSEPPEQIRQARMFLKFLAEAKSKPGHWQTIIRHQFERIEKYIDAGFYHDDLSVVNQPFYFHEFIDAAARHHLQYLGEADFRDLYPAGLTEEATRVVHKIEGTNRIAREQYVDFIEGRSFRQTLLCHQDRQLAWESGPDRVSNLLVAADVRPSNSTADLSAPGMEDFQRGTMVIATSQPLLKSALVRLGRVWPRRVAFKQLLDEARDHAGHNKSLNETSFESDRRDLGEFLIRCYAIGFVDLHSYPSTFVTEISERPMASPLARLQICQGPIISSFRHLPLKIEDALGRDLLKLLDGTRNRAALLAELGERVKDGSTPVCIDGNPVTDPQKAVELLAAQLEPSLESLARLGLLVG